MRNPGLKDAIYIASGLWFITIGLNVIVSIVKGLRK